MVLRSEFLINPHVLSDTTKNETGGYRAGSSVISPALIALTGTVNVGGIFVLPA